MFDLAEDNKDIESLIHHLEKIVVDLRKNGKLDNEIKNNLIKLYTTEISPWMQQYNLHNKEVSKEEEQEYINKILDTINFIKTITKQ